MNALRNGFITTVSTCSDLTNRRETEIKGLVLLKKDRSARHVRGRTILITAGAGHLIATRRLTGKLDRTGCLQNFDHVRQLTNVHFGNGDRTG